MEVSHLFLLYGEDHRQVNINAHSCLQPFHQALHVHRVHAYFSGNISNGSVHSLSSSEIIPNIVRIKYDLFVFKFNYINLHDTGGGVYY
jgi:hypothetical protein